MAHKNHKDHYLVHELEDQLAHLEIKLALARLEDRLDVIEDKIDDVLKFHENEFEVDLDDYDDFEEDYEDEDDLECFYENDCSKCK